MDSLSIVWTGLGVVELVVTNVPEPGPDEVVVESDVTPISPSGQVVTR